MFKCYLALLWGIIIFFFRGRYVYCCCLYYDEVFGSKNAFKRLYFQSISLWGCVQNRIEILYFNKEALEKFFFLFFTFSTLKWTNKNIIFPACSYNILNSHKKRAMKSKLIEFKIRDFFFVHAGRRPSWWFSSHSFFGILLYVKRKKKLLVSQKYKT